MTVRRRLRTCVERWSDCNEGLYDPRCCRFPKSCSATVYDEASVSDADLEPLDRCIGPDSDVAAQPGEGG